MDMWEDEEKIISAAVVSSVAAARIDAMYPFTFTNSTARSLKIFGAACFGSCASIHAVSCLAEELKAAVRVILVVAFPRESIRSR